MSELMNGAAPAPEIKLNNPIIDMLERCLADAKAGRVSSIAVIAVTPSSQTATPFVGGQTGDLYVGCGVLQRVLLDFMTRPQNQGRILRPAR